MALLGVGAGLDDLWSPLQPKSFSWIYKKSMKTYQRIGWSAYAGFIKAHRLKKCQFTERKVTYRRALSSPIPFSLSLFFSLLFFLKKKIPNCQDIPCSKIQTRFLFQESSKWRCLETISNKKLGLGPCKEFTFGLVHGKKCESTLTKKKTWKNPVLQKAKHSLYDRDSTFQQIIWVCLYFGRRFCFVQLALSQRRCL